MALNIPLEKMDASSTNFEALPMYLQQLFSTSASASPSSPIPVLSLHQIRQLPTSSPPSTLHRQAQYANLLLLRHHLTELMCRLSDAASISCVVSPELVLQRAEVYEALAYADLAAADAYVAFSVSAGEEEDLRAVGTDGEPWDEESIDGDNDDLDDEEEVDGCLSDTADVSTDGSSGSDGREGERRKQAIQQVRLTVKRDALTIMVRGLQNLGCTQELSRWQGLLQAAEEELEERCESNTPHDQQKGQWTIYNNSAGSELLNDKERMDESKRPVDSLFGLSRREIYPWNEDEPTNRMSEESLEVINTRLHEASNGCLEVRKAVLPSLHLSEWSKGGTENGINVSEDENDNAQLGLFACRDLDPGETILREHSVLTALRPHDAPLCDACAADLHSSTASSSTSSESGTTSESRGQNYACPSCSIPFCSSSCLSTALSTYHIPNAEDKATEAGYPPVESPFCPGISAHSDIHELGRAESSEEPERDLYFLLVARCVMMAETRSVAPLLMGEVKWLWGEFNAAPGLGAGPKPESATSSEPRRNGSPMDLTLPYSLHHSLLLPFEFFTTLLLSRPDCAPYSAKWVRCYDWWIIQTLYAKFRGVADAKQSSWDGLPESAGVFGLWCLGNHSCGANVEWETRRGGRSRGGERTFEVRTDVWRPVRNETAAQDDGKKDILTPSRAIDGGQWRGIKKGEQIWNHYTDTREEDFRVRRGRLREVLGGDCMCERCIWEEGEWSKKQE